MACNCIDEQEEKLQEKTGDPEAFIDAAFDFKGNLRRFNAKGFCYRKRQGRYRKNFMISYIPFDYCPFCGKKYTEDTNNA